jgi:hypothetical protein
MADAATVQGLIDYYVNLLIIQYNQKPKARATIALLAEVLLANGVMLDVLNGYNIDTAVGVQLDVIGKYVGVNRYYSQEDIEDYFAFTSYTEVDPDALPKFGFSTYATFNNFSYNGTLTYNSIVSNDNALSDNDFRTLIYLAILTNTCDEGHGEIDTKIFNLFGTTIRPESPGNMRMFYFFTTALSPLIQAIIIKKLLPKPMGVQVTYVQQNNGPMFGFVGYDGVVQNQEYGFSTYANYATQAGRVLTYDQIIPG